MSRIAPKKVSNGIFIKLLNKFTKLICRLSGTYEFEATIFKHSHVFKRIITQHSLFILVSLVTLVGYSLPFERENHK